MKTCSRCGKEFEPKNHEIYCSDFCRDNIKSTCVICNKEFYKDKRSKKKTCSKKCSSILKSNVANDYYNDPAKHEKIINKRKETFIEKYGVDNPMKNRAINDKVQKARENVMDDIKNKMRQTNLKKYGSISPFGNKEVQEKSKQTNLERYGVDNVLKDENIQNKVKETQFERYGKYAFNTEKQKETNLKKYGFINPMLNKQIQDKLKETNLKKYGSISPFGNKEVQEKSKQTNLIKYGVEYASESDEIRNKISKATSSKSVQNKRYLSMKQNKSFNVSKPEQIIKEILEDIFDKENVLHQYRSEDYPFNCDFYIKPFDLYIELNFSWTHGFHLFDENDPKDLERLEIMKAKNTKYYDIAIKVWTESDPKKFKHAIDNNLNYLVFYNKSEFDDWLLSLLI